MIIRNIKILVISIFILTSCGQKGSERDLNTENKFEIFLEKFVSDSTFQKSRTRFPLKTISIDDTDYEGLDTLIIYESQWSFLKLNLNFDYSFKVKYYSNFELNDTLITQNKKLLRFIGVDNGLDDRYFFEKIDGKWTLIKNLDLSN